MIHSFRSPWPNRVVPGVQLPSASAFGNPVAIGTGDQEGCDAAACKASESGKEGVRLESMNDWSKRQPSS